jgi:hypothetical protein
VKRTPLLLTIGIIILIAAGYYFYDSRFKANPLNAWDIVPSDALLIYEQGECLECLSDIKKSPVWLLIEKASTYRTKVDSFKNLLSRELRSKRGMLISIHATNKDDFDFVYYVPNASTFPSNLRNFNYESYRLTQREFNQMTIHEVSSSGQIFSWALINDVWVGSFTPFLIEDVIRTSVKKTGYNNTLAKTHRSPQIQEDAGNLYVNLDRFTEFINLFSNPNARFNRYGESSILDIKSDGSSVILNGFTTTVSNSSNSILSIFEEQSPVTFNLKHLVSNRTVVVQTFGVSNGEPFRKNLERFQQTKMPSLRDSLLKIASVAKTDLNLLYNSLRGEIALCQIESTKGRGVSQILMIETNSTKEWQDSFKKISAAFSADTVFYEKYGDYEIFDVPIYRFPEKLFYPLVSGFQETYLTRLNNTLILSENLFDLKRFLADIDDDNTWGKSSSFNRFFEATLLESNVSLYINTPKVWTLFSGNINARWNQFIKENSDLIRSINLSAIQFSHLNKNFYSNITVSQKEFSASGSESRKSKRVVTNFSNNLMSLYAVKSHVNRSDEILVQDSLNDLSLMSSNGQVMWKVSLGDKITSAVSQIDFFANGKLQYFFATRSSLHVIDRLGNYVEPFPIHLDQNILHASVVDYDNSKKYRFLIGDDKGQLWMFDKSGNNLDGWKPYDTEGTLLTAPQHHRIKGKDYIIAIRRDGIVHLTNRRGEVINGFPLNLEAQLAGEYFLETGNTLADTDFIVVAEDGFRIRFNMNGKVQSRETLLKSSFDSRFSLINEKSDKSYVIVERNSKHLNIVDEDLQRIASNTSVGNNPTTVMYYDFGSGNSYVTISDRTENLTFLYNVEGELLSNLPIESSMMEIRPINSDELRLFFIHGNSVNIEGF